jgi:hypothetical protein
MANVFVSTGIADNDAKFNNAQVTALITDCVFQTEYVNAKSASPARTAYNECVNQTALVTVSAIPLQGYVSATRTSKETLVTSNAVKIIAMGMAYVTMANVYVINSTLERLAVLKCVPITAVGKDTVITASAHVAQVSKVLIVQYALQNPRSILNAQSNVSINVYSPAASTLFNVIQIVQIHVHRNAKLS